MNWGKFASVLLQLALMAVPMAEDMVKDAKAGSTKKALALKGINNALIATQTIDPDDAQAAQVAATAASGIIDAVVTIGKHTGDLPTTPAPAVVNNAGGTSPSQ